MNERDLEAFLARRRELVERVNAPVEPKPLPRCSWCGSVRWARQPKCGHCGHIARDELSTAC